MTASESPVRSKSQADIGIVCALPIEIGDFLSRCSRVRKYTGGDFVFKGGVYGEIRIVVVICGMGFLRARRATEALIEAHSPGWIISTGFCGALQPEMRIGDIVVADSVADTHGNIINLPPGLKSNPEKGLYVGRVLTADDFVRSVQEKQDLAAAHSAQAVEMESMAVAQICRDSKLRCMVVRSVSDDMSSDLPPEVLSLVGATGSVRFGAAIGSLIKKPSSAKQMWQLRENAHQAAERLAAFLDGVVVQLHESL